MKITLIIFYTIFIHNFVTPQDTSLFKDVARNKLEKSFAKHSINFIWLYSTENCSYNKEITLFDDTLVIQYYSKNFNCYSFSLDTLKEIKIGNNIINRAGYYFIDSSFTIIHKNLKYQRDANNLIMLGRIARDTINRYNVMIKRHADGNKKLDFLLQYLKVRENAKEITTKDIDDFVSIIDSSNFSQPQVREFIFDYFFCRTYDNGYYYFNPGSIPFEILINHRDLFIKEYDTTQIDLRINALINFGLKKLIQHKDLKLIEKSARFLNDTIQTYSLKDTDGNILLYLKGNKNDTLNKIQALKAFYFLEIGDTTKFLKHESEYLKISHSDPLGLFFLANYYFRNFENYLFYSKAEKIIRKAFELDSNNYEIVGLLAEITYNNENFDEAIVYINKAIKLYSENGISPSQFVQLKETITKKRIE
jgi:tetratricopeptide (TPR) repeat protein